MFEAALLIGALAGGTGSDADDVGPEVIPDIGVCDGGRGCEELVGPDVDVLGPAAVDA